MRAPRQAAPLVVMRSEVESGGFGLRLIGELDLNTVEVLETELSGTRAQSPPSVIDLSELRFLDLSGLRVLLRAVGDDGAEDRLVGATGIVRRLIDLARTIDLAATPPTAGAALAADPATTFAAARPGRSTESTARGVAAGCNSTNGKPL